MEVDDIFGYDSVVHASRVLLPVRLGLLVSRQNGLCWTLGIPISDLS